MSELKEIPIIRGYLKEKLALEISPKELGDVIKREFSLSGQKEQLKNLHSVSVIDAKKPIKITGELILPHAVEERIFRALLKTDTLKKFYHYTSYKAAVEILKTKQLRLSSAAYCEDGYELPYTALNYYFLRLKKQPGNSSARTAKQERFIFCGCAKPAGPYVWEYFGDGGKGVCLEFDYTHEETARPFTAGRVLYGRKMPEFINDLNRLLAEKTGAIIRWDKLYRYRSFVKFEDFFPEQEVRLFHRKEKSTEKYLSFGFDDLPLTLKKVHPGPNCTKPELIVG